MEVPQAEQRMIEALQRGETVVVNMRKTGHLHVMQWANEHDCFVRIDRKTQWGNPFEIGKHGSREAVIEKYAKMLSGRPDLLTALPTLRGKALGCWCAPKPCHGDVLLSMLNECSH